jgi:hypothetical protein
MHAGAGALEALCAVSTDDAICRTRAKSRRHCCRCASLSSLTEDRKGPRPRGRRISLVDGGAGVSGSAGQPSVRARAKSTLPALMSEQTEPPPPPTSNAYSDSDRPPARSHA